MKDVTAKQWAVDGVRRDPTNGEYSTGFPCGGADRELFNELMFRLTQADVEILNVILAAGITPDETKLTQLLEAIKALSRGTTYNVSNSGGTEIIIPTPAGVLFEVVVRARAASNVPTAVAFFLSFDNGQTYDQGWNFDVHSIYNPPAVATGSNAVVGNEVDQACTVATIGTSGPSLSKFIFDPGTSDYGPHFSGEYFGPYVSFGPIAGKFGARHSRHARATHIKLCAVDNSNNIITNGLAAGAAATVKTLIGVGSSVVGIGSIVISPAGGNETIPIGSTYSTLLTASGGTAPYTFAVTAGGLPPGITLAANGQYSGTATTAGTYNWTVTATDSANKTGADQYTTVVSSGIVVSPASATITHPVGTTATQLMTATGGVAPYTWSTSGSVPTGLSLASNGQWSGTMSASGVFTYTVTATDANGLTGSATFTETVTGSIVVSPASATITHPVGTTATQLMTASGGTAPYTWSVTGSVPPGLSLSSGGQWSGTMTTAGVYTYTVTAVDALGHTGTATFTETVTSVSSVVVSPSGASVSHPVGTTATQLMTASGGTGPYTFTTSGSVPPGLSLASGGQWSGTMTTAGTYTYTVIATDALGHTGMATFTETVTSAVVNVVVSPSSASISHPVGTTVTQVMSASGGTGPYTWSTSGTLPPGISLASNGTWSGTMTTAGTYTYTVFATDSLGHVGTATFTETVTSVVTLSISPPSQSVSFPVGTTATQLLTASGGTGPYTFAVTSGTKPPGFVLASNGQWSGTATTAGSYTFVVTATDSLGHTGTATYTEVVY